MNFLATTTDLTVDRSLALPLKDATAAPLNNKKISPVTGEENDDLQLQLHRVLGALESNIELRKQHKPTDVDVSTVDQSEVDLDSSFLEEARNVSSSLVAFGCPANYPSIKGEGGLSLNLSFNIDTIF